MSEQAKCHGLVTQHFNMVAPQKTGQDFKDNQENWQIIKSKKTLSTEKIWKKNYPTISKDNHASSSNTMEYSLGSSSYFNAVKRNTKEINLNKVNFWDTYKSDSGDEDNQLTNSSSFKYFSIAFSNNKNVPIEEEKAESDIKKEKKKLKRKAKNLKKYIKKLQK